jgi:integrase
MNQRKGWIFQENGKWHARVTAKDNETGKIRNIRRTAKSKSDARAILKELIRGLDSEGVQAVTAWSKTFADLADYYESQYAIPARFVEGQKIEGMRGARVVRTYTACFREYFKNKSLRSISYSDISAFRRARLNRKTYKGQPRTIATVNRELSCLRRMFNVALKQGWIARNPFNCGDALILTSCEKRRERILTPDEETRLLAACDTLQRSHLRAFLIALLDTGARKGEMLKLIWRDVDFDRGLITIRAQNTKTLRERTVGITERLRRELIRLWEKAKGVIDSLVFGIKTENGIRTAFATTCKIAGIKHGGLDGLTLHCLRHTAATRLVKGNLPIQIVGRILGHVVANTTYRYLTADNDTAKEAAAILETYHAAPLTVAASAFVN